MELQKDLICQLSLYSRTIQGNVPVPPKEKVLRNGVSGLAGLRVGFVKNNTENAVVKPTKYAILKEIYFFVMPSVL